MRKTLKRKDNWKNAKQRVWIFIAYKDDGYGKIPFFSKLFDDHSELKEFSANHSSVHNNPDGKYSSTYLDLFDQELPKCFYNK